MATDSFKSNTDFTAWTPTCFLFEGLCCVSLLCIYMNSQAKSTQV